MAKKKKVKKDNLKKPKNILWFKDIRIKDVDLVGGKNASLGEMYSQLTKKGIKIPNGFTVTAYAYREFLKEHDLEKKIKTALKDVEITNIKSLKKVGKEIRDLILNEKFSNDFEKEIIKAFKKLKGSKRKFSVAVRSSATAEDLPDASFAGQQETFLNVKTEKELLESVKKCMASLFTDRAISYRESRGYDHLQVSLSVTVQQMIDASQGSAGVMFTIDTESGFNNVITINSSYGLGEYVVKGRVTPDQFYVFKKGLEQGKKSIISRSLGTKDVKLTYHPKTGTKQAQVKKNFKNKFSLSDKDVLQLAKWAMEIEKYYNTPQDIEWVKHGKTGELYIVQARPETVKNNLEKGVIESYRLKKESDLLLQGTAIGQKIGSGKVRIIESPKQMKEFKRGEVLVTRITDPDWEPIMRLAAAIITEQGGKTSHAAIVAREIGVPTIVGAKQARKVLHKGQKITVNCSKGDEGQVYKGLLPFEVKKTTVKNIPKTKTKVMMNVGDPDNAFSLSFLPHQGVGLARLEFIFSSFIRIHPLALVHYNKLKDAKAKKKIRELTRGYSKKTDYCVDKLAEGIARIAVAMHPYDVVVRLSDFKSNEYAKLIGGKQFEPKEENPMLGWRGASRYYSKDYKPAFKLECEAIKKVRDDWGLTNVIAMVPFCRTPEEGKKVLDTMAEFGLKQKENDLKVYVMCEIPSNVILADDFAKLFDGFSIGSNDLTQMTLGVDRDSGTLNHKFYNEKNNAVVSLIKSVIKTAKKHKKPIGICGQAPSDYPKFVDFLIREGITSISLNPDTLLGTKKRVANIEKTLGKKGKKTHKGYVSFVVSLGFVAAALISLGAGCGKTKPVTEIKAPEITPAEIRESVEKQVRKEFAKELEQKKLNTVSVYYNELFDPYFQAAYPSGWSIRQWGGDTAGVTFFNPKNEKQYIQIFHQQVGYPVNSEIKKEITIGGVTATQFSDKRASDGLSIEVVEFVVPGSEVKVEIQGTLPEVKSFMDSVAFYNNKESIPNEERKEDQVCIQVITPAKPKQGGACQLFPTPCDVPDDWETCSNE